MRIGIDLGGTKTEVIALSDSGEQLFRHRLPDCPVSWFIARVLSDLVRHINSSSEPFSRLISQ